MTDIPAPSRVLKQHTLTNNVTCEGLSILVNGQWHEPFAELHFRVETSRNGKFQVVKLVLDQLDFGIQNCCTRGCSSQNRPCDGSCSLHFIQKITIQARPKSFAANRFHRVQVEPHHSCQVFGKQRSSSRNLQVPLFYPNEASIGVQEGSAMSRTVLAYGWEAAFRDLKTSSVAWTWEISYLADGSELCLGEPRFGKQPLPPISPSFFQMSSESFRAEAAWEWEAPAHLDENVPQEWEVIVSISIVSVERKKSRVGRVLGQFQFVDSHCLKYKRKLIFQ